MKTQTWAADVGRTCLSTTARRRTSSEGRRKCESASLGITLVVVDASESSRPTRRGCGYLTTNQRKVRVRSAEEQFRSSPLGTTEDDLGRMAVRSLNRSERALFLTSRDSIGFGLHRPGGSRTGSGELFGSTRRGDRGRQRLGSIGKGFSSRRSQKQSSTREVRTANHSSFARITLKGAHTKTCLDDLNSQSWSW